MAEKTKKEEVKSFMRKVTREEHYIALFNSITQKLIEDELNVFIWNKELLTTQDKQQKDMILQSKEKTEALMVQREWALEFLDGKIKQEVKKNAK